MERHPLRPFLPTNAHILMLGSFPPPQKRWSMNFFYPNFQNDMWRIMGLVYFGERDYFVDATNKKFEQSKIEQFLTEKGIALFDTACVIRRLKENASDKYLEIVEYTPIDILLREIPLCKAIVTTGQKSTETLCTRFSFKEPRVGEYTQIKIKDRELHLWRMPSSSRAYPLAITKKAILYRQMLEIESML